MSWQNKDVKKWNGLKISADTVMNKSGTYTYEGPGSSQLKHLDPIITMINWFGRIIMGY